MTQNVISSEGGKDVKWTPHLNLGMENSLPSPGGAHLYLHTMCLWTFLLDSSRKRICSWSSNSISTPNPLSLMCIIMPGCNSSQVRITLQVRARSWRLSGEAEMEMFVSYMRASHLLISLGKCDGVSLISWHSSSMISMFKVLGQHHRGDFRSTTVWVA